MQTSQSAGVDEVHTALKCWARDPELDERAHRDPAWAERVGFILSRASERAWAEGTAADDPSLAPLRLDTQRGLYQLNRLRFYWCDAPSAYVNERSRVLLDWQERLELPWQRWLAERVPAQDLDARDASAALRTWAARDRQQAVLSADGEWLAEHMDKAGYRRLLEVFSLNALVEASQLARTMGGAAGAAQATLFRILIEEFGAGRLEKKHSTYFARMLEAQQMSAEPEAYLERVPWEVLSAINQAFYLTENRRHYLRFCGAFTYTELSTPVSFRAYARAAQRLGFSDGHADYWSLHIREDERHGAWMLEQVALPYLERFPEYQREILLGYAQQRAVEGMAGAAVMRACRAACEEVR